jgi:cobalt-zinc-cadmium efflux system membrane fusion protein
VLAAAARLRGAEQQLARELRLVAAGIAPRRVEEQARMEADVARALHRSALARLAALGVALEIPGDPAEVATVVVRSPRRGTVLERPVRPGSAVEAGGLLFRIADLSRLWLVADVYEREAVKLRVGGRTRVVFPAFPGRRFDGTIAGLTGAVDTASRTVAVRVAVRDPERRLRPGMAARATFDIRDEGSPPVTVPLAALQRLEGRWSVFLPRERGSFERRDVSRGRELGGDVEILKGLREGEEVVVEGAFVLAAEAVRKHAREEHPR